MATFTPPTHTEYMAPAGVDRLWSRVPYQVAETVTITDGVAQLWQIVPGDVLVEADTVYTNAVTYTVDPEDEPALPGQLGDIDLYLDDETWPAWL